MMTADLLAISDLWAGYDSGHVLQGMNLRLRSGRVTGVIGRNGVGKTTLVRTLMGLLKSRGSIRLDNIEIGRKPAHERARLGIGYVPQGRGVFKQMTVEENLTTGLRIGSGTASRGDVREAVHALFPIIGLRRGQIAGTMSGGEQQQVAIARALMTNPSLLVLDEPSEGIQPSIVHQIAKALSDLNKSFGTTIMVVEQNIDMLTSISLQHCIVIEKGKVTHSLDSESALGRERLCGFLSFD